MESLIIAGKRPPGMPFALFKLLRRVENLKVKKHLRGRLVWLSAIIEEETVGGVVVALKKKVVMGTYTRNKQLIGSRG